MVPSPLFWSVCQCDTHVHTKLCGHATGEMEEYVQAAIAIGLRKIIFLEHMEEGISSSVKTWLSEKEFDHYFSEGQRLKDQYRSQIEIGLGVECGYNPDCGGLLCTRIGARQWDQVGISCHFLKVEGIDHHLNLFSRRKENVELARQVGAGYLLDRYFTTLIDGVKRLPGTMLCHLDGALRFLPELRLTKYHYELIDELLRTVKTKRMSLEINSSGLAIRNDQFPTRRIIEMADRYGIPFLFGSDAHKPDDVGRNFEVIKALVTSKPSP